MPAVPERGSTYYGWRVVEQVQGNKVAGELGCSCGKGRNWDGYACKGGNSLAVTMQEGYGLKDYMMTNFF